MTSYKRDVVTCGACGHASEFNITTSLRAEFGPDLDLRPAERAMSNWVQRCRSCGYCAPDISKFDERLRGILTSTAYRAILDDRRMPRLAWTFVCAGMLDEASGRQADAGWSYLHAAWELDDFRYDEGARHYRGQAADIFLALLAKGETFADDGASELVAADCLRRAGRGAEALPMIDGALARDGDDTVRKALEFERRLIALGDLARYTIWDAKKAAEQQ
jgi:hypothetical protein